MNIAVITSSLPPYPTGGAERQAAETARRLALRGHRVTVFARRMLREQPAVEVADGVRWIRCRTVDLPGVRFPGHIASFLAAWRREQRTRFDVILAYQMVINGVLGRLAARSRIPLVVWIRNELETRLSSSFKHRLLGPWVLAGSRRVLFQSTRILQAMARELETVVSPAAARGIAERSEVLPNAIAVGPEPNYANRKGIVFLGRLVPQKAVDVLLKAMREMPSPPRLRILGDGFLRQDLERQAQGLPVRFEGHVLHEQVPELLGSARIQVAPSRAEGFPNVLLEGMSCGLPVVATAVGAVPDLVRDGENGFLVPVGDSSALAARIQDLLSDDNLWHRMAREARKTALGYGWESHLDRLEEILRGDRPAMEPSHQRRV